MSSSWLYVGIPLILVALVLVLSQPSEWVLPLCVGLLGLSAVVAPGRVARKAFETNATIDAPHRFTADDERLTIETPYTSSNYPWRLFYDVRVARDFILLYHSATHWLT
ncbi:MAG TPA: YcxB family protein, partial [Thermoanaerobaculia bacterium]